MKPRSVTQLTQKLTQALTQAMTQELIQDLIQDLHQLEALLLAGLQYSEAIMLLESPERWNDVAAPKRVLDLSNNALRWPGRETFLIGLLLNRKFGMPLVSVIRVTRTELEWRQQQREKARTAVAQTQATLWMIILLPPGILFGAELLGLGPIGAFIRFPLTFVMAFVGAVAIWLAIRWMRKLIRSATTLSADPGVHNVLIAEILKTGASYTSAQAAVREGLDAVGFFGTSESDTLARQSRRSGIPLVGLLQARAVIDRTERDLEQDRILALLPIRVLTPLGLFALPGFLLLTVLPIAVGLLFSTTGTL